MDKNTKESMEGKLVIATEEVEMEKRQSNSEIEIKNLLETENYIVVLDTNILLKIYRFSPNFAEFALKCLDSIMDMIYIKQFLEIL